MHGTGLAISEEHRELAGSARAMLAHRNALDAARAASEGAAPQAPEFWKDVVDLGWLGLHVAEEHSGQGFGLPELAVVIEQVGRMVAPGPFVPTALSGEHQQRVADLLARAGGAGRALDGDLTVTYAMPFTRGLTIAGGTSEIIRTQIAERVLGLPRT